MEQHKGQINNLLEDTWFFGNTLKNKSKLSKTMVRCNSDPCPSSSTNEDYNHPLKTSNNGLLRTPSLPVSLGKDVKYELGNEDEDDEEPRMGDLIRQAMPMSMSRRRLERTPSLPPCRGTSKGLSVASEVQNGRKVSVELSPFLQEKGPIGMVRLTRRASMDSSFLPPKYTSSKGTKQSALNSKNKTLKKLEEPNNNIEQPKTETLAKSRRSPNDDLQRFKDLGFSSDGNGVGPNMTHKLPGLQRRASLDPQVSRVRRPNVSEPWRKPSSPSFGPSPVPKWADHKASSAQDMKAQIKFWARAVASNVRQEC
ncbi:uncharacterized protein LOC141655786 [Silene latifolia]|uniref:uncharacterized protein LOC141655786 n=1 Tax=Silene latifolia TaxID=37657 RepID=UPI003D76B795